MIDHDKLDVLYEVYSKRAIAEGIDDLPLLDRATNKHSMEASARSWGGVVVRLECRIITMRPMNREVVRWKIVYVHKADVPGDDHSVTLRELNGRIFSQGGRRQRKRR